MRSMWQVLSKQKRLQVASEGGTVEIRVSQFIRQWVPSCWRSHAVPRQRHDGHTYSAGTLGRRASCGWLNGEAVVLRLERPACTALTNSPGWWLRCVYQSPGLAQQPYHPIYYAALLPRRGPHYASHSVCPSVCLSVHLSVRLSVRPVIVAIGHVFSAPLASRMYFSAHASVTYVLFGTHWGPHIVRPSRPHRFLLLLLLSLTACGTDFKLVRIRVCIPRTSPPSSRPPRRFITLLRCAARPRCASRRRQFNQASRSLPH